MNQLICACFLALLLGGCNNNRQVEVLTGTVVEVYEDKSPMGCMGTDWNTVVRFDDYRVARLCGKWGKPGDKLRGCLETGHSDPLLDGFRLMCSDSQSHTPKK
jgi:hypothetical protein